MRTIQAIQFRLVPREDLTREERAAMYRLLEMHFHGVTPGQFTRDLEDKRLALLLERGGELVGFSTLLAYTARFRGEPVNVIYSGDTIVTPAAWGTTALPRAWVAGVEALRASLPPGRCFWLLLTSGFRTYRFLPVFWREFFPRYDRPTPADSQQFLEQLAGDQFGGQFDRHRGVVRFEKPQQLRSGLEEVPLNRMNNPHTRYFLQRNPGHAWGDELVCLTEVSAENLTKAGRRMMPVETHELAGHHR